MSVPREDSDGAVPRAASPEPPGGASPEDTESREDLTIEAKEVREAIRFGHADVTERLFSFVERIPDSEWGRDVAGRLCRTILRHNGNDWHSVVPVLRKIAAGQSSGTFDGFGWIPPSILDAIRSECAARAQAEEARQNWERAKAATDDAIRKEEERAKALAAFLPKKNQIVEEVRGILNAIREEGELSPEIEKQCLELRSDLSDWADRPPQDVEEERTIGERIRKRAADLQRTGSQWRVVRDKYEDDIANWKAKAREEMSSFSEPPYPYCDFYHDVDDAFRILESCSSWKDHSIASASWKKITYGIDILAVIRPLVQARSEALEAIRALDEKEIRWESLLPETLRNEIVAFARERIQRAKATSRRAKREFRHHIQRGVAERFRQSFEEASDVDQMWREKIRSVYGKLAESADAPFGCRELADWIKRTVDVAAPVPVFAPDRPASDPYRFDWPWMPPQERHQIPQSPIEILSIVGDPRKAGEWFAELDRFSRDMKRHPDLFADPRKGDRLANVTRQLRAVSSLQDMSSIRNQINEFLEEIHSEDNVRNWKKLVDRLDVGSSSDDRYFFDSFRQQCEAYLDLRNDGEYENAATLYREIRARAIELEGRSQLQETVVSA